MTTFDRWLIRFCWLVVFVAWVLVAVTVQTIRDPGFEEWLLKMLWYG